MAPINWDEVDDMSGQEQAERASEERAEIIAHGGSDGYWLDGPERPAEGACAHLRRSDTIEGNGYFWTDEMISAFEDTSAGPSRFYAWVGGIEMHDRAEHSAVFPSLAEAVGAIPF